MSNWRRAAYVSTALLSLLLLATVCPISFSSATPAEATDKSAVPATLTFTPGSSTASVALDVNSASGNTATSTANASFSIATTNATGYTLNIKTSGSNTNLTSGTNTIPTIATSRTLDNFSTNTWGLLPSTYRSNNTTHDNSNNATSNNPLYFPASNAGFTMDETSTANTIANSYTVGMGIKADYDTPAGTYTNTTLVAEYVANAITYAINYYTNAGSGANITGMPSINPQSGTVSQGTTSTSVNLASAPTRTGYTFKGWCLGSTAGTSNTVNPTATSGITTTNGVDTCTTTTYSAGQSFGIDATVNPNNYYLYAIWEGNEYTATIYYNNKTSSGTSGATPSITSNNTAKCRVTSVDGANCTIQEANIPNAVKNSVGQYNNTYAGLASTTGTMSSSTSVTLTGNTTFYAVYRTSVTLYYPNATTTRTSTTLYRNQWLTSTSAMATTVLSSSTTGTSNYAPSTPVTNYSIAGYSASASTNTSSYSAVSNMAATNTTTFYMILSKSVTGTFYYNNNTTPTSGTTSVTSTTKSATQYIRCTSSAAEISNSNYSAPTGSYGTYNNALVGWATSTGTMTTTTPTTANTTFYAVYRTTVTLYKPSSVSAATTVTLYRNQWLTSTSAMADTILSNSTTGTSNWTYTRVTAVSGTNPAFSLYGFNTATNKTGRVSTCGAAGTSACSTVAALATSTHTTVYSVERVSIKANFYYNNNTTTTSCTTAAVTSTTGSAYRYLYTTSTTAATVKNNNISVPAAVSGSKGTCGMDYKNVGTSTSNMTAATPNTSGATGSNTTSSTTYYARYSGPITNYYYNSGYTNRTIYRNQWVTGTAAANMSTIVLSTSDTGTSNYSTAGGPGATASSWAGLATSATTTVAYSSVSAAATANAVYSNLYTIYQFNITYSTTGSTGVSSIGTTTDNCKVTTSSTSCTVTLPAINVQSGYESLGWGTQGHTSAGTAAGATYTLNTNSSTLYANAKASGLGYCGINGVSDADCMQIMTASDCPSAGKTVTDARDGKTYTVKLINGQCWMTQNLRLTGGAGTLDLSSVLSNVSSYTMPAESTEYGFSASESNYSKDAHLCSSDNSIGCWYNYYSATASTISGNDNAVDATSDICPKNWHLPSGPNTTVGTDINRLIGNTISDWQAPTAGFTAFGATAGGFYANGRLYNTERGNWWSATAVHGSARWFLGYNSSDGQFNGTNQAYRHNGRFVRCVYGPTMQDATSTSLAAAMPNNGDTTILRDARDGQEYTIAKINGAYWMTRNLAIGCDGSGSTYGDTISSKTLTNSDSNISAASWSTPTLSLDKTDNTTNCTTSDTSDCMSYTNARMKCSSTYGAWYNYAAASAGTIATSSTTTVDTYNICPKGWTLPANGTSAGQIGSVVSYKDDFSPVAGGVYYNGAIVNATYGYWWSTTADGDTSRYNLFFTGSSLNTGYNTRRNGSYLRCIKL